MPKQRKVTKTESGAIQKKKVLSKFRIGSRKGGKSAVGMKTEELLKILERDDQIRYHHNARAVLRNRGIFDEVICEPENDNFKGALEVAAATLNILNNS